MRREIKLYIRVILAIILVIFVIGGTYLLTKRYAASCNTLKNNETREFTYENTKIGFSFKIPADYIVTESYEYEGGFSGTFFLSRKTADNISIKDALEIRIYEDPLRQDLIKKNIEGGENNVVIDKKVVSVDGREGTRYEEGGYASGTDIVWANDKYSVEISDYPSSDESLVDSIITSFRFSK